MGDHDFNFKKKGRPRLVINHYDDKTWSRRSARASCRHAEINIKETHKGAVRELGIKRVKK
jgi:hypothetical protein